MIILDIERLWLPILIKWFGIDSEVLFPRWLHLLVPASRMHRRNATPPPK